MQVRVTEVKSDKSIAAKIEKASGKDMPLKKDGWQFSWKSLYKTEGADFYKLTLVGDSSKLQGVVMLTLMNDEMLFMNTIEVASHNFGRNGKYDKVVGCLIAFACLQSIELGRGNYEGYLTFESKTVLIPYYEKKYGARLALGQRMFIEPETGERLISQYLTQ